MKAKECCLPQKEGKSGTKLEGDDQKFDVSYHLWSPFLLEFSNQSKERQFRRVCYPSWLAQDLAGHSIGVIIGPVFVYSLHSELPLWYSALWLVNSLGFAHANVHIFFRHRDFYARWRFWSVVFVRVGINLCMVAMSLYLPVIESSLSAILLAVLTRSPTGGMFYTSLVHRLEFKHHLGIHTIALLEALLWIPPFCQSCTKNPGIAEKFSQVGYGIDWLFSYTFLGSSPDPVSYPCWVITAMFVIVIGFIIPTFFVFVTEVSSRSMFLQSRLSSKFRCDISEYTQKAFSVAMLGCMAAVFATWFVLSLIRNPTFA